MKQIDETPQYKHDCDDCIFLGRYDGHDLYFHKKFPVTVLARFGNNGPDYVSGLLMWKIIPVLHEAAIRAVAQRLMTEGYLERNSIPE